MVPLQDGITTTTEKLSITKGGSGIRGNINVASIELQSKRLSSTTSMTDVHVHYSIPEGQRYLPIVLNDVVTMVHLGQHDGHAVYEPTNMLLKSPEDGLRFHKSMSADDMFEGPLDLMPFGNPVVGAVSTDELWMINPQAYDPTVPSNSGPQKGEIPWCVQ